jgi:hypothetical protein
VACRSVLRDSFLRRVAKFEHIRSPSEASECFLEVWLLLETNSSQTLLAFDRL